jgi:hypothetical protein
LARPHQSPGSHAPSQQIPPVQPYIMIEKNPFEVSICFWYSDIIRNYVQLAKNL